MKYTLNYFRTYALRREARRWLKAQGGVATATRCMFLLNRYAKGLAPCPRRDTIYELKNQLVEALYRGGYCYRAKRAVRLLECWACQGSGSNLHGDECYKCEGSGIWKEAHFYLFIFRVESLRYAWHQPAWMVDKWARELDLRGEGPPEAYEVRLRVQTPLEGAAVRLYMITIHEYLRSQGYPGVPPTPGLWESLREDLIQLLLRWDPVSRLRQWARRVLRKPNFMIGKDEIPF